MKPEGTQGEDEAKAEVQRRTWWAAVVAIETYLAAKKSDKGRAPERAELPPPE